MWVGPGPSAQLEIDLLQQFNITGVVAPHEPPCGGLALHTALPQMEAGMGKLSADLEIGPEVVKPIGDERKLVARDLEGVDRLIRTWRLKAVFDKTRVGFLEVEFVAVVGDDDIGLVKEPPQVFDQTGVVLAIFLLIVREGYRSYALVALPLVGGAENIP